MDPFEVYEHRGMTIELHYDDAPEHADPRDCDGNMAVLFCWHPHYKLGDEQFSEADFESVEAVFREVKVNRKATVILPLFLYDHSGITMRAGKRIERLSREAVASNHRFPLDGDGWDTSWVGFAYTTEALRKECGVSARTHDELEKMIDSEVEVYDQYLRGEVYGYVVKDAAGDVLDSCWGFLGEVDRCKAEAEAAAELEAQAAAEEALEAKEMAARDIETV